MRPLIHATLAARSSLAFALSAKSGSLGFTYYSSGNAAAVVTTMAGGRLLSGGGIDDDAATRLLLGWGGSEVDVVVPDACVGDIYCASPTAYGADSADCLVLSNPGGG
jgi:hypothetical protein